MEQVRHRYHQRLHHGPSLSLELTSAVPQVRYHQHSRGRAEGGNRRQGGQLGMPPAHKPGLSGVLTLLAVAQALCARLPPTLWHPASKGVHSPVHSCTAAMTTLAQGLGPKGRPMFRCLDALEKLFQYDQHGELFDVYCQRMEEEWAVACPGDQ